MQEYQNTPQRQPRDLQVFCNVARQIELSEQTKPSGI